MTDETESTGVPIGSQSSEPARGPSIRDALTAAFDAADDSDASETPSTEAAPTSGDVEATDDKMAAPATEAPGKQASPRPEHWSAEDWAELQKLPEPQQQYVLRKEKDLQAGFTRKTEEVAQQRKRLEAFDRTLGDLHGQYAPQAERGQFEQTLVQTMPMLVQYYANLQRDPLEALTRLAEAYNVTDKLTERLAGLDTDENARTLRRKEMEIADREAKLAADSRRTRESALEAQINSFREAKAEDGSLRHPYFADVEQEMATLISANPRLTLDDAYDRAVKVVKYDELMAKERESAKAEAEAARRSKIKDIRKSPAPNGRAGKPVMKLPENRRDALRAVWDQLESQG